MAITVDSLREAETNLKDKKEAYLRQYGWTNTCNTPGSFWLWERDFSDVDARRLVWWERSSGKPSRPVPYGRITVPLDLAVVMTQRELEPDSADDEDVT